MNWIATNADEHVLCDAKGSPTEYRVRRDPMNGLYRAYDGDLRILERLSLQPCKVACEEKYTAERQLPVGYTPERKKAMREDLAGKPPRSFRRAAYNKKRGAG